MTMHSPRPKRPARRGPPLHRTLAEAIAFFLPPDILERAPIPLADFARGDGQALLFLPPLLRGDASTAKARFFLARLGYAVYGWNLGVNLGPTEAAIAGITRRLAELSDKHGPVSLVGYSMGGLFARLLAHRHPERVRQVITVCSPIDRPTESLRISLEPFLDRWRGADLRALAAEIALPLHVPATAIYSRDDGIVAWRHCRDPHGVAADNIEVRGAHTRMSRNPQTLRVIAERLARPGASLPRTGARRVSRP